jgi:Trypsin-like peptidase domain
MRDFEASIARIFSGRMIKGAGFLVSDNHLMTCAHVIAAALNLPRNTLEIPTGVVEFDLPLIAPNQRVKAKVVFWQPVKPGSIGEDIAVLEVLASETLPIGVKAVQLIIAEEAWGHTFRAYGFPQGNDDGVWVEGVIREKQASQWIQIEGRTAQGYAIESGFSGTPIWDESLKGVIGMTVAAEREREEARVAYLIPSTVLKQAWSTLVIKPHNKTLRIKSRRKISLCFAATSLVLLVVFHFLPPVDDTQRYIVIVIISLLLIIASLVFVNTLEKREDIGLVEIHVATSIFSLAVAISSSFIFISSPFEGDGYTRSGKISFQYYTASQPFSVLSFAKSKFSDEFRDGILKSAISPLIYDKSPAFLALKKFIIETGNDDFIEKTSDASISYNINYNGQTKQSSSNSGYNRAKRIFNGEQRQSQTREDFEKSGIGLGQDANIGGFSYITILTPFQDAIDNAKWTSFIDSNSDVYKGVGAVLQYPKLSTLLDYNIKKDNVIDWKRNLAHDTWIKRIVENNPDNRGFLGYIYKYFDDPSNNGAGGGCGDWSSYLETADSTPYIRFADIVNSSKSDIRISEISYRMVGQVDKLYSLNNIDDRVNFFKNGHVEKDNLEPSGFSLRPDQHLLIPIEFGFETNSHNATFLKTPPTEKSRVLSLARKKIYISKPNVTYKNYKDNGIAGIAKEIQLSSDFIDKSKLKDDLLKSIPKRFSVGPVINLESVSIDKKADSLPAPMQDMSVRLFEGYQAGSCPYVSVQHKNSNSWQDLGTVLYGRSKSSLQDTEIRYFGDNINSIKIEEKEKEITYIDYLSVLYFDPSSQQDLEIFPQISAATRKIDGKFYTLKQGEIIKIDIQQLLPSNAQKIRIKINGYYLPLADKDFRFPATNLNATNANQQ